MQERDNPVENNPTPHRAEKARRPRWQQSGRGRGRRRGFTASLVDRIRKRLNGEYGLESLFVARSNPKTDDTFCERALIALSALGFLLSACGSLETRRPELPSPETLKSPQIEVDSDRDRLARSAQTPLYDLNLKRDEIPPALEALEVVYGAPRTPGCAALIEAVAQLNATLGPDPAYAELQRHLAATSEAADDNPDKTTFTLDPSDAVESTISGFVPYSGIIRRLSGAEKHKRKLAAVILRGQLRRAYLMGIARHANCAYPARWDLEPETIK